MPLTNSQMQQLNNIVDMAKTTKSFSSEQLNFIAELGRELGLEDANMLLLRLGKLDNPQLQFNPNSRLDSNLQKANIPAKNKPSEPRNEVSEHDRQAVRSIIVDIIIAANAHMLQQLEARRAGVKAMEANVDPQMLNPDADQPNPSYQPSQNAKTPSPAPTPKPVKGHYSYAVEQQNWKNYLLQGGYNYNDVGVLLKNGSEIVGSDNYNAMRQDYITNYRNDETLGAAARQLASGRANVEGVVPGETAQQTQTKSPYATPKPVPPGAKE